jgi:hypothetical protein
MAVVVADRMRLLRFDCARLSSMGSLPLEVSNYLAAWLFISQAPSLGSRGLPVYQRSSNLTLA